MKTTKGAAYDASTTINRLIEEPYQTIPQTVAYRLAKIHRATMRYGVEVERHMMEQGQVFGKPKMHDDGSVVGWYVPEGETRKQYNEAIKVVRDQEIELDVTPIPIAAFGTSLEGLNVNQFHLLGDFVCGDPLPEAP